MIFSLISLNSFSISSTKEQIQSMRLYFGIFSRWLARTKNVTSYPYSLEDYMIPKVVLFWGSRSCLHGLPSNGNIFLLSGRLIHLFVWFWNWSLYFYWIGSGWWGGRGGGVRLCFTLQEFMDDSIKHFSLSLLAMYIGVSTRGFVLGLYPNISTSGLLSFSTISEWKS